MKQSLREAQEIIYEAFDARGKRRIELAHKALSISKDCADAYVLLSEESASGDAEAIQLLEEGVRAGERALGKRVFRQNAGDFWLIFETRPYMRARFALALHLHSMGERERAIEIFTDLLRLNPNDNQGARYELATCLLEERDYESLENLLERYREDGSAVWLYSRALLKFRQEGCNPAADDCLRKAVEENPFVLRYLLGKKRLPAIHPAYFSRGEDSEAVLYAHDNRHVWEETPGARAWLESLYPPSRRRIRKRR